MGPLLDDERWYRGSPFTPAQNTSQIWLQKTLNSSYFTKDNDSNLKLGPILLEAIWSCRKSRLIFTNNLQSAFFVEKKEKLNNTKPLHTFENIHSNFLAEKILVCIVNMVSVSSKHFFFIYAVLFCFVDIILKQWHNMIA